MYYVYTICMKNGKEYKTDVKQNLNELINQLMSKDHYEIKIFHCNLFNGEGRSVAIIGSEVSSIEYIVTKESFFESM